MGKGGRKRESWLITGNLSSRSFIRYPGPLIPPPPPTKCSQKGKEIMEEGRGLK